MIIDYNILKNLFNNYKANVEWCYCMPIIQIWKYFLFVCLWDFYPWMSFSIYFCFDLFFFFKANGFWYTFKILS